MNFHFTHPHWLIALVPALAWVVWLAVKSDVQTAMWRRWTSGTIRVLVVPSKTYYFVDKGTQITVGRPVA